MPLRFCAMQVSTKPAVQLESEDAQYRSGRMFGRKGPSRLARWVRQDVEQPPLLQGEIQDHLLEWQPSSDLRSERRTLQQQWAPAEDLDWDPGEPQGVGPQAAGRPTPLPLFEVDPFGLRSAQHRYRARTRAIPSLGRPAWVQKQPHRGADGSSGNAGAAGGLGVVGAGSTLQGAGAGVKATGAGHSLHQWAPNDRVPLHSSAGQPQAPPPAQQHHVSHQQRHQEPQAQQGAPPQHQQPTQPPLNQHWAALHQQHQQPPPQQQWAPQSHRKRRWPDRNWERWSDHAWQPTSHGSRAGFRQAPEGPAPPPRPALQAPGAGPSRPAAQQKWPPPTWEPRQWEARPWPPPPRNQPLHEVGPRPRPPLPMADGRFPPGVLAPRSPWLHFPEDVMDIERPWPQPRNRAVGERPT